MGWGFRGWNYPASTQFTPSYKCRETGERIKKEGNLVFLFRAKELKSEVDPAQLGSISLGIIKKIPRAQRSSRQAWKGERVNVYASRAKYEQKGMENGRYLMQNDDVGEFLFSVSKRTASRYFPETLRFLRGRNRRQLSLHDLRL